MEDAYVLSGDGKLWFMMLVPISHLLLGALGKGLLWCVSSRPPGNEGMFTSLVSQKVPTSFSRKTAYK